MAETAKKTTSLIANGDAFVLSAGIKFEDINNLNKYGKEAALKLVDKETKNTYFAINTGSEASISKYGVTFTGANDDGYAELTGCFPKVAMDKASKKEWLRDNFAFVIPNLEEIQAQVEKASKELEKAIKAVDSALEI